MKGHCACVATGMSSHAIARAFGRCASGGFDHPWDPADLKRCADYIDETGITTDRLTQVMTPVSDSWAALLPEWDSLVASMREEFSTGRAPITYRRMRDLLGRP
jgi:hypothetical protein